MLRVEIHLKSGTVVDIEAEDLITNQHTAGKFLGFELIYPDEARECLRYIDFDEVAAIKQVRLA